MAVVADGLGDCVARNGAMVGCLTAYRPERA
jgi:hypothetical protein